MYLKKLMIKNFRIFDEIGIELIFNKGVNAIIGENNSGKSSVIDALRIVYSTVAYKKDIFFQSQIFMLVKMEQWQSMLNLMCIWKMFLVE